LHWLRRWRLHIIKRKKQRSLKPPLVPPKKVVVISGIILMIGLAAITLIFEWRATQIRCQVADGQPCPADIEAEFSRQLTGKPLLFFPYRHSISRLEPLSQPFLVSGVSKTLAGAVTIDIVMEDPAYVVAFPDKAVVATRTGLLFQRPDQPPELVTVRIDDPELAQSAQMPLPIHTAILTILEAAEDFQLPVVQITWLDNSTIRLSMKEQAVEAVIDAQSPRKQLFALKLLLESPVPESVAEPIDEIDLRFTMPVLRTQP
jgi:hypothetical protein